ncbi:MAG TPA: carboxypeptidase-like regulatory domain-containing protein [Allosphingosinicella sp.]|nr:carboxypeptidase-like regulatory domain-containing protein [Allosphingosinicella sp.]
MRDILVSFPKPCDEAWGSMAPAERGRLCGRCDRIVHDLSQYDPDRAQALLRSDPGACVRARIGADGGVMLKPARGGGARRMIAAAAAAGLLAAGTPAPARTVAAKPKDPAGAIAGKVQAFGYRVRVTARSSDGRSFRTKSKSDGRFRINAVPPGAYTLTFKPDCGETWTVGEVVVGSGETIVPSSENENGCIVVGMIRIEDGGDRPPARPGNGERAG